MLVGERQGVKDNGFVRCRQAGVDRGSGASVRGMPCLKGWRGLFEERLECRDQQGGGESRAEERGRAARGVCGRDVLVVRRIRVRCFACVDDASG
jgi:hypothetical protein